VSHLYIGTRILYSLARAGYVPAALGAVDRRGVPLRALAGSGIGMTLAVVLAARGNQVFLPMYGTGVAALLSIWILIFVCHWRFRNRLAPDVLERMAVRVPFHPLGSIVAVVLLAAALAATPWVAGLEWTVPMFLLWLAAIGVAYVTRFPGGIMNDKIFEPRRLGHANLWVKDLKRSEGFYHDVCGLTVEFWEPDLVATFLGTGNTPHDLGMIETTGGKARYGRNGLLQIPEGVGVDVGLGHLAWELRSEVELVEAYRRAKARHVAIDMTVDHQVARSLYLSDPDGNSMEYYCDTVKDWRKILHGEMELITSAWDPEAAEPAKEPLFVDDPEIREVREAPIHPTRVTHAVLLTDDVEKLSSFHRTVGGLAEVHRDDGVSYLRGSLDRYRYHLAICAREPGERRTYHHVSFELESEEAVEAAESALRKKGIEPEISVDDDFKRSFFMKDPDGLLSEYYIRRSDGFPELSGKTAAERPYLV
jgi:catechol 2,3-dioxygenase